ncbi:MAG: UxaA family hydrolase [Sulfolobales archaeon]
MRKAIILNPKDNVAIALTNLKEGDIIEIPVNGEVIKIRLVNNVPFGHKVAVRDIREGEQILKYGEVIGIATKHIRVGEHVHIHNVVGLRGKPQER